MPQASITKTMAGAQQVVGRGRVRTGEVLKEWVIDLPKGDGGELTTRTSATIGTATMDEATHSITTGMTVNVFWDVGGTPGVRYGVTVGTVAGLSVPFSGGSGDNLPVATSGLVITEQVDAVCNIDGDKVQLLGVEHQLDDDTDTGEAHVQFRDTGAAEIHEQDLEPNKAYTWDIVAGDTNDFTGNPITDLKCANGSSSGDSRLIIISLEDTT